MIEHKEENPKENKFQAGKVATITVAHFVHDVYSSFLAPILPLLIEKLSLNYTLVGLLTLIQRIPSLFNWLIGIFADNIPLRYLVILSPAITTIVMSLMGLAPNFVVLAILLFIMGISAAMFHVPTPILMQKVAGDRVGKGMSFYMIGGEAARSVGPIVITSAVTVWGLEGTYKLIPFGIIASIILYFKFKNIRISDDYKQKKKPSAKSSFKKHARFFIIITFLTVTLGFMKSAIVTFLPTYLKLKGDTLWFGSISLSVFEAAGVAGAYFAGTFSDKIGRIRMLLIITFITPFCMLLFTNVDGIWILPVLLVMGLFVLATNPVLLALVVERDNHNQSFLNGIFMTIIFFASSVTSFLIGLVSDFFGLIETFQYAAYFSFLAIPASLLLAKIYK